jgi:ribosomal protein S18 acetylase RimI-like enzyme
LTTNAVELAYRAATPADTPVVARLLTQLYEFEAPGMIDGNGDDCASLVESTLRRSTTDFLRGTYLLVRGDETLAMGAVATAESPREPLWYRGMRRDARGSLGRQPGRAFMRGIRRLMAALISPIAEHEAQLHSIVVNRETRGSGAGAHILRVLEQEATNLDKRDAVLTVLNGNPAKDFYHRFGYRTTMVSNPTGRPSHSPYPSTTMSKPLPVHPEQPLLPWSNR